MKFAYTGGPYKEYRGYVFANGNPAEVTDKATIEALSAIGELHAAILSFD